MPRFSDCWRCGTTAATVLCDSCKVAKYCTVKCKENDIARHKDAECHPASVLKQCSSCHKTGPSLLMCTGCYRDFYCDKKCQTNHRREHKVECKRVAEGIKSLAKKLGGYFIPSAARICMQHYYWGNVPAYDLLNLEENEGNEHSSPMNVLILGVGDLRNIILSCASLPDEFGGQINFYLNDVDKCVLARLVLFLYMMIKCDSSTCIGKFVTEIWYSLMLSESTYNCLRASLQGLVELKSVEDFKIATAGLVSLDENHFKDLQGVWERWLSLKVEGTSTIQEQRNEAMNADFESIFGKISYYNGIPQEHVPSAKKYMEDGVFQRTQDALFAENPTLTGPPVLSNAFVYCCPTSVLPFVGWDYVDVKKFKHDKSLVRMFGTYIEDKLRKFMKTALISKQVSFEIILGDCMKLENSINQEVKFDRILTSNLMDYILLPDLLRAFSPMLNRDNPYATLITESQNWVNFCPDADVSMMPLSNPVQTAHFRRIVLRDTNSRTFAKDDGTSFREYLDNSDELNDYLRALFHVYHKRHESELPTPLKLRNLKELGNEFQLRLRNGFRNENRIIFFKRAVNRRRVTMITGLERNMEWVATEK